MTTPPASPVRAHPEPDWPRAVADCRRVLADLIAFDTTNPPGNENVAVEYLKRLLEAEGIECRTYEPVPGRGNLVARLRGSGRKPPLLVMGHLDVVGVERDQWDGDPFHMEERDGFLYGRGVIDDKGMVAAEAVTMLWLKRLGIALDRDVILLAECDEESGGKWGVRWMIENHLDAIRAEFAINEGGRATVTASGEAWVGLQTAEKRGVNFLLTASGKAGHASMPREDNCIAALGRALVRVTDPLFPVSLTAETKVFFGDLAPLYPGEMGEAMRDVGDPARAEAAGRAIGRDIMFGAMLRHTVSPTLVKGGFRGNVIPAQAEATLNVRMLPGTDPEALAGELRRRIADPRVAVSFPPPTRPEAPAMPFEGPVVEAARAAASEVLPGAVVVPLLSTGATDSAQLRAVGIQAYGLLPFPLTTEDTARMHGENERMPVASLETGLRLLYGIVARVAGV